MKIGPYTVSRGSLIPYTVERRASQTRRKAADGSITVVEKPDRTERYFHTKIKVPRAEANKIADFLETGVGYARDTFTLVDGFGTSFTVRFWDGRVRERFVASNVVELDLLFRREVVAP